MLIFKFFFFIYKLIKERKKSTNLLVPTASISSMKTIEGALSAAALNNSLTNLGPSPEYFWMSSEPTTRRKVALV